MKKLIPYQVRESARGERELFLINTNSRGQAWVEAWTPQEGHMQMSYPDAYRTSLKLVEDVEAEAF